MESLTKQRDIVFSPNHENGVGLDAVEPDSKIEIGDDQQHRHSRQQSPDDVAKHVCPS